VTTVVSGLNSPAAVAVDAAGDLFIANTSANQVLEVFPDGTQKTISSGWSLPQGIAVDAAGDVFVSDTGNNRVVEIPSGADLSIALVESLNQPLGIALDARGDLFIAESGANRVLEMPFSTPPSHRFANTEIGQTSSDSSYSLLVANIGNQPLNFGQVNYPIDFPVDFTISAGADLCISGTTLTPGQLCALAADFTPQNPGSLSESLGIEDNSLAGASQSILLSGTALLGQSIVFLPPASVTFGAAPINLSPYAGATSSLPVSFKVVSGPATLKGSVLTFTGAGSVVVQANQAGNSSYVAAAPVSKTITVAKATPVIRWVAPASIVYGTKLGAAQLDAKSPVPGKFVYSPAAGKVLPAGTATLSVTFTPTSAANYLPANAKVTITVTKAPLTVTAKSFTIKKGAAIPALTAIYAGFANGDTVKVLSGKPALTTTAKAGSPVGKYPITIKQGTLAAKNYAFKFVNGTLTIAAASGVKTRPIVSLPPPPPVRTRAFSPSPS